MPARMVKTFKKELGHRAHRDHRTRRRPLGKRARRLRNDYRRKREEELHDQIDKELKDYL